MNDKSANDFGLDASKIGRLISDKGLEHAVYEYGEDKVLKVPKKNLITAISERYSLKRDYELLKEYFPELLDSGIEILTHKLSPGYECILQNKLNDMQYLRSDRTHFHEQMRRLRLTTEKLYRETGYSVDFSGGAATFKNVLIIAKFWRRNKVYYLSNLVVSNNRLYLIDYRCTPTRLSSSRNLIDIIYTLYGKLEYAWINWLLRKFS